MKYKIYPEEERNVFSFILITSMLLYYTYILYIYTIYTTVVVLVHIEEERRK